MTSRLLVSLSTLALVAAQAYDSGVYGLGYWNETYAIAANQNPNNTKSVPFQIGTQNYTFQVNVAEYTPTGAQANRTPNPRQAASFYNLLWSGDETLNETLRNAVTSGAGVSTPQLCVTIPMGTAPRSTTNNYREEDNGDCSHALGKECMDALKNIDPTIISQCNGFWMPKSCSSKLGSGGLGSASKLFSHILRRQTFDILTSTQEFSVLQVTEPLNRSPCLLSSSHLIARRFSRLETKVITNERMRGFMLPFCLEAGVSRLFALVSTTQS